MLTRVAIADLAATDELRELRGRYRAFMEEHVYPNERALHGELQTIAWRAANAHVDDLDGGIHCRPIGDDPVQSLDLAAGRNPVRTGDAKSDELVYGAISGLLTKIMPGYGELFRMLSWEQIGSGAMLSRASGGIAGNKLLFAMPGSTAAVELAMTKLILPELKHLLHELRK